MGKKINEFDSLWDMGTFPWAVHLGASLNIVFTIWLTSIVFGSVDGDTAYLLPFAVIIISLNVLPVIVLRICDKSERPYPVAGEMDFFKDQHRFASWVYGIASGNMLFWITFGWWVLGFSTSTLALVGAQVFAFVVTYVPLWRGLLKKA